MAQIANERITTRVTQENKELLERAVAAAKQLVEQDARVQLFREDAVAFANALERPVKMNDRFLQAARKHKETITNADSNTC